MGALLPPEHQEESHRQSSAATTKSTLPKQGRDDLEAFSKQTSFLVLMLKNVLNHPALFGPGSQRCQRCIQPLGHGCSAQHWHVKAQRARLWQQGISAPNNDVLYHETTDALLNTGISRPNS